jgi:hypothetical protein
MVLNQPLSQLLCRTREKRGVARVRETRETWRWSTYEESPKRKGNKPDLKNIKAKRKRSERKKTKDVDDGRSRAILVATTPSVLRAKGRQEKGWSEQKVGENRMERTSNGSSMRRKLKAKERSKMGQAKRRQ